MLIEVRHPSYFKLSSKWLKWRLAYQAGDEFLHYYLHPFTKRESHEDFEKRRILSYVPAFAKAALNDIKNSIYQRLVDIERLDGPQSFQDAVSGQANGVDLLGSTMSYFMGQIILPELLSMAQVGIYVDMPQLNGPSKLDKADKHPYLYHYPVEDILSWCYDQSSSPNEFSSVLLRDNNYTYADNLPNGIDTSYRHLYLTDKGVQVDLYDCSGTITSSTVLAIPKIPFVPLQIPDSLLADVANYQIALMNLESSDLAYVLLSNYPFYTEQYDPRPSSQYLNTEDEITVGPTQGRLYPVNTERPAFIHPSPEPLKVSMEKQDAMKRDIKLLVNLAVSNLSARGASAESKYFDQQGLEAGLSYIGLILENAESKIASYWALYENTSPATIIYPTEYHLPDTDQIRKELDQDAQLALKINSPTYKKEITKRIVRRSIGSKISKRTLRQIENEIDSSIIPIIDPTILSQQIIDGIVSMKLASEISGYPEGDVEQARLDQAKKLAMIQAAQVAPTRGIPETQINSQLQAQIDRTNPQTGEVKQRNANH